MWCVSGTHASGACVNYVSGVFHSGTHASGACVNYVCGVFQEHMQVVRVLIVCLVCFRNTCERCVYS